MQKHLAIGRRVKIIDQKNREVFNEPPCQSNFKEKVSNKITSKLFYLEKFCVETA